MSGTASTEGAAKPFRASRTVSHGCTVGELDAEQLFFLRARGIPEHEGRSILVRAFLEDALEPVTDDTAREMLETEIARWWEGLAL